MHTVEEIRKEYQRLDRLCRVDTALVSVVISPKSVRLYGSCTCKNGRPVCIRIAAFLLEEDAAFWDTVRHEYATRWLPCAIRVTPMGTTRFGGRPAWRWAASRSGWRHPVPALRRSAAAP